MPRLSFCCALFALYSCLSTFPCTDAIHSTSMHCGVCQDNIKYTVINVQSCSPVRMSIFAQTIQHVRRPFSFLSHSPCFPSPLGPPSIHPSPSRLGTQARPHIFFFPPSRLVPVSPSPFPVTRPIPFPSLMVTEFLFPPPALPLVA